MNCKKGDLAVTRGTGRNSGRLVQCVEFVGHHMFGDGIIDDATWRCDTLGQVMVDIGGVPWSGLVVEAALGAAVDAALVTARPA